MIKWQLMETKKSRLAHCPIAFIKITSYKCRRMNVLLCLPANKGCWFEVASCKRVVQPPLYFTSMQVHGQVPIRFDPLPGILGILWHYALHFH